MGLGYFGASALELLVRWMWSGTVTVTAFNGCEEVGVPDKEAHAAVWYWALRPFDADHAGEWLEGVLLPGLRK